MPAVGRLLAPGVLTLITGQPRDLRRRHVQPVNREAALPVALKYDAAAVGREAGRAVPGVRRIGKLTLLPRRDVDQPDIGVHPFLRGSCALEDDAPPGGGPG